MRALDIDDSESPAELAGDFVVLTYPPGTIPEALLEECVLFRTAIYVAEGYLPQPEQTISPDCHDAQSTHILARFRTTGQLVAYCRMIHSGPSPLPIAKLYPQLQEQLQNQVEISRFCVHVPLRGALRGASMAPIFLLVRELLKESNQHQLSCWYCLIDKRFQQLCKRFFKIIFHTLGPPVEYLGSPTVPAIVQLSESIRNNINNPELDQMWDTEPVREWIKTLNRA